MRLAIFTSGTYPFQIHGAEIGIFYLAKELALQGGDVSLYLSELTPTSGPVETIELPRGMKLFYTRGVRLRFIYNISFVVLTLLKLRSKSEKPNLIAVNVPTLLSLTTAYLAQLMFGIPYLVIIHGPPDLEVPLEPLRRVQCFLVRTATRVVCVSKDLRLLVQTNCAVNPHLFNVIPNGFDELEIRRALTVMPPGSTRAQLVFVGSLDQNKDPLTLIRCFKIVSESTPDVQLAVVGTGPLESRVRELVVKERLQDRVVFHDFMKHSDLLSLLAHSTLLVVTSHREGMPTVVIEALALGKPVVTTSAGGLSEIVRDGENGYLAPIGSAGAVAQSILRILGDPKLRERLSTGAEKSAVAYEWSYIANSYYELFKSILTSQSNN